MHQALFLKEHISWFVWDTVDAAEDFAQSPNEVLAVEGPRRRLRREIAHLSRGGTR
jgi:hypothetical protein